MSTSWTFDDVAGTTRPPPTPDSDADLLAAKVVPRRRPGQWVDAAAPLVVVAMVVHTLFTNPRIEWNIVAAYFTEASILRGLLLTIWLTAAVMVCGYVLGIVLAVMRLTSTCARSPAAACARWSSPHSASSSSPRARWDWCCSPRGGW